MFLKCLNALEVKKPKQEISRLCQVCKKKLVAIATTGHEDMVLLSQYVLRLILYKVSNSNCVLLANYFAVTISFTKTNYLYGNDVQFRKRVKPLTRKRLLQASQREIP